MITTNSLIQSLYTKLSTALPNYNVFLNDDGQILRNSATVDKDQTAEINCVSDALSQTGCAIVVCARMSTRVNVSDGVNRAIRKLIIPIKIYTQDIDNSTPKVVEIIDDIECKLKSLSSVGDIWEILESGEFEDKPGFGFVKSAHNYTIGK